MRWRHVLLLTCLAAPGLSAPAVRDISITSADGLEIYAAERVPEGDGPFPALLIIHGGDGGMAPKLVRIFADPKSYNLTIQEFAKRDWVLLSADFRRDAVFGKEEDDVEAAFRYLQRHPKVDAKRICAWGGSHGGQLALRLAERVGEQLACAGAGSPWLTDPVTHFFGSLDEPPLDALSEESKEVIRANRRELDANLAKTGVTIHTQRLLMEQRSIVSHAGAIRCPVLLVTSKRDQVVPHATLVPLIDRLRELSKDLTLYTAESGRHGFYMTPRGFADIHEHNLARTEILRFMDRHLGRRPMPRPGGQYGL